MTIVSNFTQIIGDAETLIGDGNTTLNDSFPTEGRDATSAAFLIFNIRGLTHANQNVAVRVNGTEVGTIKHYFPGGPVNLNDINDPNKLLHQEHSYTQIMVLAGSQLNDGVNDLEIEAVRFPGNTGTNTFDDFFLSGMMCFYHRNV